MTPMFQLPRSITHKKGLSESIKKGYICFFPLELPTGYFWYGKRCHSFGRPPKWVQLLLEKGTDLSLGDLADPVSVAAESVTEPVTQADASFGEPAKLIVESTSDPVRKSDVSFSEPDSVC